MPTSRTDLLRCIGTLIAAVLATLSITPTQAQAQLLLASPAPQPELVAQLRASDTVSSEVVELFDRSRDELDLHVVLRGQPANTPFYRPLRDDSAQQLRSAHRKVAEALQPFVSADRISGRAEQGELLVRASPEAAMALARHPNVLSVSLQRTPLKQAGVFSLGIVGLYELHQSGITGTGSVVAVIDQSFSSTLLGASVQHEECFYGGKPKDSPRCPNGGNRQSGPGASAALPGYHPLAPHGTRVASLVAHGAGGGAPSATLVTLAAHSKLDVFDALHWIADNPQYGIDVVVLSLGDHLHTGVCDGAPAASAWLPAINAVRQSGVIVVAAAGNDGNHSQTLAPSCLSEVVSVAGTWSCTSDPVFGCPNGAVEDQLWTGALCPGGQGSNLSAAVDVAAPSGPMTLIDAGNGMLNAGCGTSWAAPIVGACAALARQYNPGISQAQFLAALSSTDRMVNPPAGSPASALPRMNCPMALDMAIAPPMQALNQHGLTGHWYNPFTPGQGLTIEVFQDSGGAGQGEFFANWYTYSGVSGGSEQQRWYSLQGPVTSNSDTAELTIYANYGGNFAGPPATAPAVVGHATLHLDDCNAGTLVYSFHGGPSGVTGLNRLMPNIACGAGGNSTHQYLHSGNYASGNAPGQGLMIELNSSANELFAGWYTYAVDGEQIGGPASQRWLTIQGHAPSGSLNFSGMPVFETVGGMFDSSFPTQTNLVGWADIEFNSSCNQGVLDSTVTIDFSIHGGAMAGESGVRHLGRVGPSPAGCE